MHEQAGWNFWFTAKRGDQFRADSNLSRLLASVAEADTTHPERMVRAMSKEAKMGQAHPATRGGPVPNISLGEGAAVKDAAKRPQFQPADSLAKISSPESGKRAAGK